MFARVSIYGIVLAALLMTACSQNETELKSVPEKEPVAITFSVAEPAMTRATNGYAGFIDADNQQLKYTGFGVFAGQNANNKPDLMYNQKVTYTFLADDDKNGYWSYYPIKYWPADPRGLYFAAYAPYVESIPDPVGEITGITGMTANNQEPYLDYTLSDKLEETVDLLWTCHWPEVLSPFSFNMYHALARVAVNVKLKDVENVAESYKSSSTKVLIRKITLSTTTAVTKGRLKLDEAKTETVTIDGKPYTYNYPTWTTQATGSREVNILNTDDSNSYGIIAEEIRYIEGMPYSWQPDGLQLKHVKKEDESWVWEGVLANALCAADHHQAYVYFIPNSDALTLTCKVYYTLMDDAGHKYDGCKTATAPVAVCTPATGTPLRGNLTYQLNLEINPTP